MQRLQCNCVLQSACSMLTSGNMHITGSCKEATCMPSADHIRDTVSRGVCALRSLTSRQPDSFQYWTLVFNYDARCGDNSPATPVQAVQVRAACHINMPVD